MSRDKLMERDLRKEHHRMGGSQETFDAIMAVEREVRARSQNTPDSLKDG